MTLILTNLLRSDSPMSSMRLNSLVWSIGGFIVWAFLCITATIKTTSADPVRLIEIPSNILVLISASWTAQVTQKVFGEKVQVQAQTTVDQIGTKGEEEK